MFSFKNKLDPYLYDALEDKIHKNIRVIIICKTLVEKTAKKITNMKCDLHRVIPNINCISAVLTPRAIERLLEYPEVKYIAIDKYALICAHPNSSSKTNDNSTSNYQRNLKHKLLFKKLTTEKLKLTGKNIGIGLIDTGIYPHTDLVNGTNRITKFDDLINNYHYPYDDNGHGTFLTGIICASNSSSKHKSVGIAPRSHIHSIKAFNKMGKGYISDILYALDLLILDAEKNNIKVICLPFETLDYDKRILSLFERMFSIACSKNIVIVTTAGNNNVNFNSMTGIATLKNCITVAGLETSIKPFEYSSRGNYIKLKKPDVSAPCVNIFSLNSNTNYIPERNGIKLYPPHMDDLYTYYSGTSCAAATISGLCALLYEYNSSLKFKDVLALLKLSCQEQEMSKSIQGAGIVDLEKIL